MNHQHHWRKVHGDSDENDDKRHNLCRWQKLCVRLMWGISLPTNHMAKSQSEVPVTYQIHLVSTSGEVASRTSRSMFRKKNPLHHQSLCCGEIAHLESEAMVPETVKEKNIARMPSFKRTTRKISTKK